ncbi:MAG TPA: prepilin-type N-terminal cleavage/methylation domain-containing protein [Pirellulaceae bacterium]|jgi:prepilin-type N-terminal cleavage/methylation domain-containing protein|nr:prepilin-type N-terminal cleavage/methylation domain-containing protein [Pirellulaceae bacterium]
MIKAGRPAPAIPSALRRDWRRQYAALMRAKRGFAVSKKKRGFTLVELLVVIAIIAILAAILSVAVGSAIAFVNRFTIGMEVRELEMALTQYNSKYGAYPPCVGIPTAYGDPTRDIYHAQFKRHLDTAFRNHREALGNSAAASAFLIGPSATLAHLDASETLPFFLGGAAQYSAYKGNAVILGLKNDPIHPLTGSSAGTAVSFYEFKPEQLVDLDGDGLPSYIPGAADGSTPLVYFNGASYKAAAVGDARLPALMWPPLAQGSASYAPWIAGTSTTAIADGATGGYDPGIVRPYINGRPTPPVYYEPDTYQLLSAGLDSAYGSDGVHEGAADAAYPKHFTNAAAPDPAEFKFLAPAGTVNRATTPPTPTDWVHMSREDEDNVANFTEGQTFGEIGLE